MGLYKIVVEVHEDKLRKYKAEGMSIEYMESLSIEGMIQEEMGWVGESGIYVESIEEIIQQ